MLNTSSTGIRKGWSIGTLGHRDVLVHRRDELEDLLLAFRVAVERLQGRTLDDGNGVAGELVLGEQVAHFHLDEVEQLGIIDHVDLVQEDDERGTPT